MIFTKQRHSSRQTMPSNKLFSKKEHNGYLCFVHWRRLEIRMLRVEINEKSGTRCRSSHLHVSIISAGNCLIKWSLWKVFPHASAVLYANADNRNGKSKIANRVQKNHGFYSYNKMLLIGDAYDKIDFDFRRFCVW